jgi:glycosyltransferase involved in cell wall biosynthesis
MTRQAGPCLGVVTNFFPSLTETFIYQETLGVERLGVPVRVYSVRRPPEAEVSEEVRGLRERTSYLLPPRWTEMAAAHLGWLLRRPLRYVSTLALLLCGRHERRRDRARTLAHFAEGVLVASRARGDNVGHLHAHYAAHAATIALAASRLLGVPFSFTGHAYDLWQDRLLLPQKLRACRFAVTCTQVGKRVLLAAAPEVDPGKVSTVYHGVDTERFRPGTQPGGDFHILSVSRLDKPKGHHLMLVALAALSKEGYRFRATVVGDGPELDALKELARRLGLAERVRFTGRVYHEELPAHYQGAQLFVLPCYMEGGYQDNLPNVLLEAMACSVPVISTRMQGIPELIEDGVSGLLVEPRDVGGLAAAIRRLMDDPALAERLGRAGRARVAEHFDQVRSVERLAALYRRQLEARATGLPGISPRTLRSRLSR